MTPLPDRYTRLLPTSKGAYALILHLETRQVIQVGRLGAFDFPAGYYLYVGSAFGPGGLAARLGRHLTRDHATRPLHWHIDYLRRLTSIVAVWFAEHQTRREHDWAGLAGQMPGAGCPVPRFGASDCRCRAHLFHFDQPPAVQHFSALLTQAFPADRSLQIVQTGEEDRSAMRHPTLPHRGNQ
jgi:Uri superfamily endonuclease